MQLTGSSLIVDLSVNQQTCAALYREPDHYYNQALLRLPEALSINRLRDAMEYLFQKHEVLTARCFANNDAVFPRQWLSEGWASCSVIVVTATAPEELRATVDGKLGMPYDPFTEIPIRCCYITTTDGGHYLALRIYALWSDAWTMLLISRELCARYYGNHQEPSMADLILHRNFSKWQHEMRQDEEEAGKAYWQARTAAMPARPIPFLPAAAPGFKPRQQTIAIYTGNTFHQLRERAASLNSTLPACLLTLLARYLGQFDASPVQIGYTPFSRNYRELDGTAGPINRSLPLLIDTSAWYSWATAVTGVSQVLQEAIGWSDYHLWPSDQPAIGFEYIDVAGSLADTVWQPVDLHAVGEPFQCKLSCLQLKDELHIYLYYEERTSPAITLLVTQLQQVLESLLAARWPLPDISPLEQQIIRQANESPFLPAKGETLLSLFDAQVALHPDAIAIEQDTTTLTYQSLYDRSTALATLLHNDYAIQTGCLVAIAVDRSPALLISILAILRSGAAYIPLDPGYPVDRINQLLESSGATLFVGGPGHHAMADRLITRTWLYNDHIPVATPSAAISLPEGSSIAYVMYTSGSTGEPKGCVITHDNLSHYLQWANWRYLADPAAGNTGLLTTIAFDLTVTCLFLPLLRGKRVILAPLQEDVSDTLAFAFGHPGIDTLKLTPAHLSLLEGLPITTTTVRTVIVGGEQLSWQQVQALWKIDPAIRLFNEYGPTETTVGCVVQEILPGQDRILIGTAISQTHLQVLDAAQKPCAIGVWGELYIGGAGVGSGYWRRPDLTAAVFLDDQQHPGQKIYRTGDQVRWLATGELEYAGRLDDQLKVRGYRIEPGEITTVILQFPGIQQAVVLASPDTAGVQELKAYYVSDQPLSVAALRQFMASRLPAHMVPDNWIHLTAIPLTTNGKTDRKQLLALGAAASLTHHNYVAPRTAAEKQLAEIWSAILDREQIGVYDHFLELGGHSLKATRLANQLYKTFGVRIRLKELLAHPVLEQQALLLPVTAGQTFQSIVPVTPAASYPVSSGQRRLWILSQFSNSHIAYNIPAAYRFSGNLQMTALKDFFRELIERHEILRTTFEESANGVQQVIVSAHDMAFGITVKDCRQESDPEAAAARYIQDDFVQPFDLRNGPLFRTTLYQLSPQAWILSFVMHHIISDGWSMEILLRELLTGYNARVLQQPVQLPVLAIQYKDYAHWQQQQLQGDQLAGQRDWWLQRFQGELPVLTLPQDRPRPAVKTYQGSAVSATWSQPLLQQLQTYCRQQNATLFMGLLASLKALLYKYAGQQDIIVGSPVAGRTQPELDDQLGLYMNTLALRTQFDANAGFEQLLQQVKETVLGAFDHQLHPFDELIDALQLQRDLSRHPLFDVMLLMQHQDTIHGHWQEALQDITVSPYDNTTHAISKFDLLFAIEEQAQGLTLLLEYNTDIFDAATATGLLQHWGTLLQQLLDAPTASIRSHSGVDQQEQQELIELGRGPVVPFRSQDTLVSLFLEQVALREQQTALIFRQQTFSFQWLDQRSNELAWWLIKQQGLLAGDNAAIHLERSEWLIVALLAVLKAGAAYVPIDTRFPPERVQYIKEDAHCRVLIDQAMIGAFQQHPEAISSEALPLMAAPQDLCYVIYTSGSTGQPKGCMLQHEGVVNRLQWMWTQYGFSDQDIILQKTTSSFDVSVWELFLPLCFGATMVLCQDEDTLSQERIASLIHQHQVTCVHFVPSLLRAFLQQLTSEQAAVTSMASLKKVITSGEALPLPLVQQWYALLDIPIYNLYGPTEASVDVTYYDTTPGDTRIPIGKPIWNTQLYIIDENGALAGRGMAGELCIGGVGVAKGYLNQPALTAERFVMLPAIPGQRLYKTGDQARWLPDGNIEYLGRKDSQVKIRGQRIELAEIESQLLLHPAIEAVAVAVKQAPGGEPVLVAYTVGAQQPDGQAIRTWLQQRLPVYMLPAVWVPLDSLPLSANGKTNRAALPEPGTGNQVNPYTAPRNETESKLVLLWSEVLGMPANKISIHDDFFALGGHSLKATRLLLRLNKTFGVHISIEEVFMHPTIAVVSDIIRASQWLGEPDKGIKKANSNTIEV